MLQKQYKDTTNIFCATDFLFFFFKSVFFNIAKREKGPKINGLYHTNKLCINTLQKVYLLPAQQAFFKVLQMPDGAKKTFFYGKFVPNSINNFKINTFNAPFICLKAYKRIKSASKKPFFVMPQGVFPA